MDWITWIGTVAGLACIARMIWLSNEIRKIFLKGIDRGLW